MKRLPYQAPSSLPPLPILDGRVPRWNETNSVRRRCPFCGSRGTPQFRRPDGLLVNYSSRCGAYFISPAPDQRQLEEFYTRYFVSHRREELNRHRKDRLLVREMCALDPLADQKVSVLASLMPISGKRVLDVGFGMGQQMLLFKKLGALVHGIDLDPEAVQFAQHVLLLHDARRATLEDLPRSERYDLITMHDLIEHPLDPRTMLRHAVEHLAPSGMLSLWTPNASRIHAGDDPILFRVDLEHMQYLTPQTCNFVADRLGLRIVHLETTGTPRLEQIRWLSGQLSTARRTTLILRRMLRLFPGFVTLNAIRRRLISRPSDRGAYHLFCVFQSR
jgi:2-polyprenyl-3-methyl-5-hydroxy-6-metoxy-1,4-benzoquinol methylase